jgi:hypothetical protein
LKTSIKSWSAKPGGKSEGFFYLALLKTASIPLKTFVSGFVKLLVITLFCLISFSTAQCQTLSFTFKDYLTLPRSRNIHGISGMEFIPERHEWQLAGDRGQYHLFRNIHELSDWVCEADSSFKTGLDLEAVRYDVTSDTYFAVENDKESYVGFKPHAMPQPGESFERLPLPHAMPLPAKNKGIEALAITPQYVWVAPEAGSREEATLDNPLIHFYRYKKANGSVVFDAEFSYEMDRNICPSDTNEALGGISEIISIPGDENRLLVLERCYEKTTKIVTVKLYEAQIDEVSRKLIKLKDKPAFDFNGRNGFRPDNLESMAWGEDADGKKILVVISDDNGSKSQWTQVILLEMQSN